MPNPGKSEELKQKLGSKYAGTGPVMPVQKLTKIPEPLRRLEESGLQFWNNAFKLGSTWLKESDLELLQVVCEQLDERDILRVFVLENIEAWHERAALRVLERDLSDNLKELGFTEYDSCLFLFCCNRVNLATLNAFCNQRIKTKGSRA